MSRLLLFAAAACFFLVSLAAVAQAGKEAFKEFKKIEGKIQAGITYVKYREALGEANVALNLYLEGADAKQSPELATLLASAMEKYKDAGMLWALTVETRRVPFFSPGAAPDITGATLTNALFQKYPVAKERLVAHRPGFGQEITREDFLTVIWNQASLELKRAAPLIDGASASSDAKLSTCPERVIARLKERGFSSSAISDICAP
jgi:hypothetical protein